ncbi:helix-turn-helix domain-containing protein [Halorubrum sp. CBA1125]|uniref:IclR family transcriptional regulator n=1 Tax=Halorubrum sp. CBA1125 TaxID=2668072 RepID=UPI0012E87E49|nr:IclR family transcriptional regulator [Halorubrum sp. CBA1125]MUW13984.1 helix-turn-helix domain-containing protein [Halorubrum sp. CBA1125]
METDSTSKKRIKSTQTAFDIVEAIAERDRPSVSDIAEEVDHSRSTVHYHLQTLQQNRYVIRDDEGLRLGLRMAHLGRLALRKHRLTGIVEKMTEELATDTNAVSHAAVKEGDKLVWLYRSEDPHLEELPTSVGKQVELHCTAYGQAILAHLPSDSLESVLAECGLPAHTENTLTDRDELESRLSKVRQLGFAYSSEEFIDGIASIASPIVSDEDGVLGAIGITTFDSRIENPYMHTKARRFSDELPGKIKDTARVASDRLGDTT